MLVGFLFLYKCINVFYQMYIIIFASQDIDGICTFLIVKNCHHIDSVSILKCNNNW
jgi:hypothetical protein